MMVAPWNRRWSVRVRLGVAALLVVGCGLAGASARCEDMPGSDFIALLMLAAVQVATALWSFAAAVVAWLRWDRRGAGIESLLGLAMLGVIPAGFSVLVWLLPACER